MPRVQEAILYFELKNVNRIIGNMATTQAYPANVATAQGYPAQSAEKPVFVRPGTAAPAPMAVPVPAAAPPGTVMYNQGAVLMVSTVLENYL